MRAVIPIVFSLSSSNRGVRNFQTCVLATVKDQCSPNEIIPDTGDVSRFTEDLFRRYQWTCEMPKPSPGEYALF